MLTAIECSWMLRIPFRVFARRLDAGHIDGVAPLQREGIDAELIRAFCKKNSLACFELVVDSDGEVWRVMEATRWDMRLENCKTNDIRYATPLEVKPYG